MKIEILYPSICNLYGDGGNVLYLKEIFKDASFIETGFNDIPAFVNENVDLIYMGPTSEANQEKIVKVLTPYKERIKELIDIGTFFLIISNANEIFGKTVKDVDGSAFNGLGLIDINASRDMFNRINNLYMGYYDDIKVVGFQTQFTKIESLEKPLFKNELGMGLNPNSNYEGIRKNNYFGTYLIGPILIINPDFTKQFLKEMGHDIKSLPLEDDVYNAYKERCLDFENIKRKNK